jgi:hypothetical protein
MLILFFAVHVQCVPEQISLVIKYLFDDNVVVWLKFKLTQALFTLFIIDEILLQYFFPGSTIYFVDCEAIIKPSN